MPHSSRTPLWLSTIALCALTSTADAQVAGPVARSTAVAAPVPTVVPPSHASRVLAPGTRPVLIPTKPPRSSLNKHLLIGAGVGALIGSAAYFGTLQNRCTDCWSIPQIEVPMYVGGGALAGYAVGGVVYLLRVAPKKGDAR